MSCTIHERGLVTINGSPRAWGGVISSVTLSFGFGNNKSTATATVVKEEGKDFALPEPFEKVTVGVGETQYKMVVSKYSTSTGATSVDSLQVLLVDSSYETLDLNIIQLAEMDRMGGGIPYRNYSNPKIAVHLLGKKYVEKTSVDEFGNIVPEPDGLYIEAIAAPRAPLNLPPSIVDQRYGMGATYRLTNSQWENRLANLPGKVLYEAREVFNLLNIPVPPTIDDPEEKLSFTGTFRQVLDQLANYYGFFYWWDMEEERLRGALDIDLNEGYAMIEALEESCRVTSKSENVSAENTYAKAAYAQFDSSWTATPQGTSQPASNRRFHKASLLAPNLSFRSCATVNGNSIFKFGSSDVPGQPDSKFTEEQLQAMKIALLGEQAYAVYVIQSLLAANRDVELPGVNGNPPGLGDQQAALVAQAKNLIWGQNVANLAPQANAMQRRAAVVNDGGDDAPWPPNKFIEKVYHPAPICELAAAPFREELCACLYPLNLIVHKSVPLRMNGLFTWLDKWKDLQCDDDAKRQQLLAGGLIVEDPFGAGKRFFLKGTAKWGDQWNIDKPRLPVLFAAKKDVGKRLFDQATGLPNASTDPMFLYLSALAKFVNRFFVVERGGRTTTAKWFRAAARGEGADTDLQRDYGYYISASERPNLAAGENGVLTSFHPAMRLDKCKGPFLELFKALEYTYTGEENRIPLNRYPPFLDFVYWMDKDIQGLKNYFKTVTGPKPQNVKFSVSPIVKAGGNNEPKMWVVDRGVTLEPIKNINGFIKETINGIVPIAGKDADKVGAQFEAQNNVNLYLANRNAFFLGPWDPALAPPAFDPTKAVVPLTEADLNLDGATNLKCWYTVEQGGRDNVAMASSGGVPYNFICNWLALPEMTSTDNVFNATYEATPVSATDLGFTNDEFAKFSEDQASPFSYKNKLNMAKLNKLKAETSTFKDTSFSRSTRVSFLLFKDESPSIPTPAQGLDGISLSVGDDETSVELVVGDETLRRVAMNFYLNKLNNSFNAYASSSLAPYAAPASPYLQFLGIGR